MGDRPTVEFDHHDTSLTAGQWRARYEQLRTECPVAHVDRHGGYELVSGYAEVRQVTLARDGFSSADGVFIPPSGTPPVPALEFEGVEHRAWRRVFDELLSPRAVRRLQALVTEVVDAHVDVFAVDGSVDLVPAYTHPVPGAVIGRLFGLEPAESQQNQRLADTMFAAVGTGGFSDAFSDFSVYLLGHLHARRAEPRDDLLTRLASGRYQGMDVDDSVAVQMFVALLVGGHHSTASGLAGLVHHAVAHHDVRAAITSDSALVDRAVEESLRLTTPLPLFARTCLADTAVGGQLIDQGARVMLNYAAANRDPDEFADPNRFRLDRPHNRHLAFGGGSHVCVGQHLARLEMRIGLLRLLERLPDLALSGDVRRSGLIGGGLMTIESMPVSFTPAGRS